MKTKDLLVLQNAFARILGRRFVDGAPTLPFTNGDFRAFRAAKKLVETELLQPAHVVPTNYDPTKIISSD